MFDEMGETRTYFNVIVRVSALKMVGKKQQIKKEEK